MSGTKFLKELKNNIMQTHFDPKNPSKARVIQTSLLASKRENWLDAIGTNMYHYEIKCGVSVASVMPDQSLGIKGKVVLDMEAKAQAYNMFRQYFYGDMNELFHECLDMAYRTANVEEQMRIEDLRQHFTVLMGDVSHE